MASEIVVAPPIATEVVEGWGVLLPDKTLLRRANEKWPEFTDKKSAGRKMNSILAPPGAVLVRLRATVEVVG